MKRLFFAYFTVFVTASVHAAFPVPSVDCQSQPQVGYPFCDPTLNPQKRATDLVSRLTLEELVNQTSSIAPAIPRLGINAYNWRSNCLHGWTASSGGPGWMGYTWTVFPAPINLGATFDKDLVLQAGQVTSTEGRALHNEIMAKFNGASQEATGLNCFSPNVNLLRDPRWGRAEETFGEDPYLISQQSVVYTKGLQQGNDPKYTKIAACAKHYAVHSGPDQLRAVFTANVTLHDLYGTYLPAFRSQVVGAKVMQMMPAYSAMKCKYEPSGAPDAANDFLLKTVLREQFDAPNISVCSDNAGVIEVFSTHHYVDSEEEAAAVCMNATTDIDLGHDNVYPSFLPKAYMDGIVKRKAIEDAVWRNFFLRIRTGDFDPASMVSYQLINASQLNLPTSQALNLRASQESIVLLKNSGDLPLVYRSIKNLAVIGPNGNVTTVLLSNYPGIPDYVVTVLQGIQEATNGSGIQVDFTSGCSNVKCSNKSAFNEALNIASKADYVVAVMGLDVSVESEGHDRANTTCESVPVDNLALPGCQGALMEGVMTINSKVILVLVNGGPVSIPNIYTNKAVVGIIEAFYPGPLGGRAVADVLFGKYNPGGKMPYTVFNSTKDIPSAIDYNMTSLYGRTYRYYTRRPLVPFGFGLSYTRFEYSKLALSAPSIKPCDSLNVSATVQNTGQVAGDEVIQVYVKPPRISGKPFIPNIQLVGFERVNLDVLKSHAGEYKLNPYLLSLVDEDGEHYLFPGQYTVVVTGGLEEARLTGQFTMEGPVTNVKDCPGAPQCLAC